MPDNISVGSPGDADILGLLVNKIGSANWQQWQIQRWQWYDYVRVPQTAASTASLTFFTNVQGSQDPISGLSKNLEQTNMVKPNTFGQQYFIVQQIRTSLTPLVKCRQNATVAAYATHSYDQLIFSNALRSALSTGVLNLVIGQKAYFDIVQPWRTAPAGFGLGTGTVVVPFDRASCATGNAYIAQSNSLADVYSLTPPQLIEPEQTFQCSIDFPDLGVNFHNAFDAAGQDAAVEAGVIFDGYLARPVQ